MREWIARIRGAGLFGRVAVRRMLLLTAGQPLIMIRERDNPVDSNAIKLSDMLGKEVGYVERGIAAQVAPFMDAGAVVMAAVYRTRRIYQFALARIWIEVPPFQRDESRAKSKPLLRMEPSNGKDRVRDRQRNNRRVPARSSRVRTGSRARTRQW